jgi:hypothetical protein
MLSPGLGQRMQLGHIKRRKFLTLLGGTAAWPLTARAQQPGSVRRIGVLHTPAADDPQGQVRNAAFLQGLAQFGWTDGGNVRIETTRFCRSEIGIGKLQCLYGSETMIL